MKFYFLLFFQFICVHIDGNHAVLCGCKFLRSCYEDMLHNLLDKDEEACIENAGIGTTTVTIFLKALKQFCGSVINVTSEYTTYEKRHLYEAIIFSPRDGEKPDEPKPVILLEAGQQGGTKSVNFALYIIEQLIACEENHDLIQNVRWVILPSTNPDGQEYGRYNHNGQWKKNLRVAEDGSSVGVDISRNFDNQWGSCPRVDNGFSHTYPGPSPASENETVFIKSVIGKYKKDLRVYVSIRRDGHAILYPYGYTKNTPPNGSKIIKIAGDVTTKVNQRAGGIRLFVNTSIFDYDDKARCGHSVDYAYDLGIPLTYEMRVFLDSDNRIMSKFQKLPRGYEASLRNGYYSAIRELYNIVIKDKQLSRVFK